jgi:hypothetical protein
MNQFALRINFLDMIQVQKMRLCTPNLKKNQNLILREFQIWCKSYHFHWSLRIMTSNIEWISSSILWHGEGENNRICFQLGWKHKSLLCRLRLKTHCWSGDGTMPLNLHCQESDNLSIFSPPFWMASKIKTCISISSGILGRN